MILTIKDISKSFNDKLVITNINLTIEPNTIYCLLGKNGAGKSTLINLISNIIDPDNGKIYFGKLTYPNDEIKIKRSFGLQSQFNQLIGELSAYDFLEWVGLLYGLKKDDIHLKIKSLLGYFFEENKGLNSPSNGYSEGMKKKLTICAALLHRPELLILDEPFANLDVVTAVKLCKFLNAYKTDERIILISSHDLLYVDKVATNIGVLHDKHLVFNGSLEDFKNHDPRSLDAKLLEYLNPKNIDESLLNSII